LTKSAKAKRNLSNAYITAFTCELEKSPYCITLALINAKKGNLSHGFAFSGENAYRAKEIISVKELVEKLKEEYNEAAG